MPAGRPVSPGALSAAATLRAPASPREPPPARSLRTSALACAPELDDELRLVGELAALELGVDLLAVDRDLEHSALRGHQGNARELILVRVEDLFRQTGGFCQVASRCAVFDLDVHRACSFH